MIPLEVTQVVGNEVARQRSLIAAYPEWVDLESDKVTDKDRFVMLVEEVGEIARPVHRISMYGDPTGTLACNLYEGVIQTAALCVQWINHLHGRRL